MMKSCMVSGGIERSCSCEWVCVRMCVQYLCPHRVRVWPLGCTLQSVSLPSPPVWVFLLQPFERALLITVWWTFPLPLTVLKVSLTPPRPFLFPLSFICALPVSIRSPLITQSHKGVWMLEVLALPLKVSLSQCSPYSPPPILTHIWQRSGSLKVASTPSSLSSLLSLKVSPFLLSSFLFLFSVSCRP